AAAEAIWADIVEKSQTVEGQAEIAGDILQTFLSGGAAKATGTTGRLSKILSKVDDLLPGGRTVLGSVDEVMSASRRRMIMPTRVVRETVGDYIKDNLARLKEAGGKIVYGGTSPKGPRHMGNMNPGERVITLYENLQIQDLVEELAHFRQAQRDGYWGVKKPIPAELSHPTKGLWELQIDELFKNLGMVPGE
ncbi:MAG: hypothetical protein ACK5Q5_00980, partial [Planctomycetaceae bacterium]